MAQINEARKEYCLNIKMRYPEGIMTRREWLKLMHSKGATVNAGTKNRIDFNRRKFNRMNYAQQAEYEKKCNEKVPCYELRLNGESCYFEITKYEFEYFQRVELSEDLNTERCELGEKIEAGIATPEEIEADTKKETDFINKYYN